jgi:hypothetical protein
MIIEIIKIGINNMKNNPCIILLILIAHNGLQIFDVAGFSPQMFIRRTELSLTTKLSAKHETANFL